MGVNREKADALYRKIAAIQMELVAIKDKAIAEKLLFEIDVLKKEIESTGEKEYIEKTRVISYEKYDSRIPAFKGIRVAKKIRTVLIVLIVLVVVGAGAFYAYTTYMANQQAKYEDALAMMVTDFEGAYPVFQELGNYDQSSTYASFCLLCIELKELECSDTPVEFSIIQSKISQFDEYNMEVEYDFDELRNIVIFAEGLYGTYWEGGGHVDSISNESFMCGCKISDTGAISACSFRTDGFLVDATWNVATKYTFYVLDGQLCAVDNKYHDMEDLELFFYPDYISYQPYASVSEDVYILYKK